MKNDVILNIGGKLQTGDVVGIAGNNCTYFGWYVEPGQYGSLKYLHFASVINTASLYNDFKNGAAINSWTAKKFTNGLNYKSFPKDYIISFGVKDNRAFKIPNPAEFFQGAGDTEQQYIKGKEILNSINFPAK